MQNELYFLPRPPALAAGTRVNRPAAAMRVPAAMLARGHGLTPLSSKEGSAASPWYLGVAAVSRQSCGRYPGLNFARENDVGGLRPGRLRERARLGGCELRHGFWGRSQGLTVSGTVTMTRLRAACTVTTWAYPGVLLHPPPLTMQPVRCSRISSINPFSLRGSEPQRAQRAPAPRFRPLSVTVARCCK